MPRNKKRPPVPVIAEEVEIAVTKAINQFKIDDTNKELPFPSSLTSDQRAFVHNFALQNNLKSKSRGKGPSRFVTVYKPEGTTIMQNDANFPLSLTTVNEISTLLVRFPVTNKERQEVLPYVDRDNTDLRRIDPLIMRNNGVNTAAAAGGGGVGRVEGQKMRDNTRMLGRLNTGVPAIPPVATPPTYLLKCREELPITSKKEEIINLINSNQVVIVTGETGSGKTTQVPQYVLEHCHSNNKSCRIVCAQPRRISAVSVSERVAAERGEELGHIVGYQIRLESKTSPRCLLTYCTYGVLLRSLMAGDAALSATTHVIIDEVHERDRHCDFLLLVLRDMLARCRGLRLILMSATLDISMLTNYFRSSASIAVPGRQFDVEEFYLEDILRELNYTNKKMLNDKKRDSQQAGLNKSDLSPKVAKTVDDETMELKAKGLNHETTNDIDCLMEMAWENGNPEAFEKLLYMIRSLNLSIDHRHTYTNATLLIIAAAKNNIELVDKLLSLGANAKAKACNDTTALDWAIKCGHTKLIDVLTQAMNTTSAETAMSTLSIELSPEDREKLDLYQQSVNDENVDLDLIVTLITKLHSSCGEGAIMVFLPGYDEIVDLAEKIKEDRKLSSYGLVRVFMLHSNMQTNDQRNVFKSLPSTERKIILSTNIAETSITIDDVVFVIDAGKVKEKSYDAAVGICSLRSMWISKACAKQRKGRAGRTRPGICYHLFSRKRLNAMQEYQTPEILRLPLQELCLQTKLLAPSNTSIADFLAKAPEPPPNLVTRNAVNMLKLMDALTPCEDLTDLGQHLIDLPIEPRLGKALLFSIVLRCLDPVLTIVCTLAYKDPFNLPAVPALKKIAHDAKIKLSAGTLSDHMAILRAFQLWQEARTKPRGGKRFCDENFISSATLEMVMALRSQLLGQLRASGFVRTRGGNDMHELNQNSDNWAVIKAALTAGLYPNLARIDKTVYKLRTHHEVKVGFHMSSVLMQRASAGKSKTETEQDFLKELTTDWILYEEISRMAYHCNIKTCTLVSPITVFLFAGSSHMTYDPQFDGEEDEARCELAKELESDSEAEDNPTLGKTALLKLDDWANFRLNPDKARIIAHLRQKLHSLFIRRLKGPSKSNGPGDEQVLKCIVNVLTAEEKSLNLPQPLGIGQKPKHFDFTNSDSGSNISSGSPCLSPTLSNDGSGSSGDLYPPTNSPIRYFIIKNGTNQHFEESLGTQKWTFSTQTSRRISKAQKEGKSIVMIVNVQRSGGFQGYAKVGKDDHINSNTRQIEWLKVGEVPFNIVRNLLNPWNENQRVQHSKDGQELETNVAETLCQFWERIQTNRRNIQYPPHPLQLPQFQPNQMMDPQGQYGRPIRGSYPFPHPSHNGGGTFSPNHSTNGSRIRPPPANKYY